jgi:hypothetical protein
MDLRKILSLISQYDVIWIVRSSRFGGGKQSSVMHFLRHRVRSGATMRKRVAAPAVRRSCRAIGGLITKRDRGLATYNSARLSHWSCKRWGGPLTAESPSALALAATAALSERAS